MIISQTSPKPFGQWVDPANWRISFERQPSVCGSTVGYGRAEKQKALNLMICRLAFSIFGGLSVFFLTVPVTAQSGIGVTPNFAGREMAPDERIELRFSRFPEVGEGVPAFILNRSDVTALFVPEAQVYGYLPKFFPLPVGENYLTVYLIDPEGQWKLLREFNFLVKSTGKTNTDGKGEGTGGSSVAEGDLDFIPHVSLNLKGESNINFFPETGGPERPRYLDTAGQGTFQMNVRHAGWTFGSQFAFAGSNRRQEALRFAELGDQAPPVDLSSYLIQLEKGRFKVQLGHVSFGSQRHLINNFSSRGLNLSVPVGRQNEILMTALNGTSIVGFDNFIGITRADHQVLAATFAREFLPERPGGLRLELTVMRGSLLPLNGFNEKSINDAEKNYGGTVHLGFRDKSERLRFEGGFTRTWFTNPADPLLEQEQTVAPVQGVTRNARFIEVSFDFFRDLNVWKNQKLKLTGTFRHEEIDPLFRSIAAFNQADRRQNQFEVTGNLGQVGFGFGNLCDRDNLGRIASILITNGRRNNYNVSVPLNTLFTPAKSVRWLPRIGYNFDFMHQFGEFLPAEGEFTSPSQVPDQKNYSQNLNAQWDLTDKFRFGYRYSRSFQDNRQAGRELADFRNVTNAFNLGYSGFRDIELSIDLSRESNVNFEQPRTDQTFRLATGFNWQNVLVKNLVFNSNFSTILAGDRADTYDSRNLEFDAQLAYRFEFGKEKYRKTAVQIFFRYANRYGSRFDRLFRLNDLNKNQGLNFGLNLSFF